ncbi:isoamylase early set domain-containing protein [Streptomyces sp. NPDC058662]|uniref:isoamylase early set domain-containing protein n=1 Tax=Streptomyces sp. NPDC058662 TaxID=3346583 RepID=UPI003664D085
MLERKQVKDRVRVTFVLPAEAPPGAVSVVGDFNEWRPGAHPLEPRRDGMRAVTVVLPAKGVHSFRYLADGDHWFDEDQADGHDGTNSRLHT